MINWNEYKDQLKSQTLQGLSESLENIDQNDVICGLYFFIGYHYYNGSLDIIANVMTTNEKKKHVDYYLEKSLKNDSGFSKYYEWNTPQRIYDNISDGEEILEFNYPIDYESIKANDELYRTFRFDNIKASIETLKSLSEDEVINHPKIANGIEFCYSDDQSDICIASIGIKIKP